MANKLSIEETDSKRTETGTLEIWAVLKNKTTEPISVECRTQFFDRNKKIIENPSEWTRIFLNPRSIESYKVFSTKTDEIRYYYIEIREGR